MSVPASPAGGSQAGVTGVPPTPLPATPHMDWPAVFAGALLASAIGFVLMSFGTGLGLAMGGPIGDGRSPRLVAITVGLWTAWVVVSSFMAGGYLAGRLRRRAFDATAHEVEVRDGSHGVVVWALGVLIAGYLTASGITSLAGAGVGALKGVSSTLAQGAASSVSDPMDYLTDTLFRSEKNAGQSAGDPRALRSEVARIVTRSVQTGELSQTDRDYLTAVISRQTGLDQNQAKTRIDEAMATAKDTADKAKAAAEKARKSGILASFLAAALLLASAASAWWAATMGGKHRDEGTDFSRFVRW